MQLRRDSQWIWSICKQTNLAHSKSQIIQSQNIIDLSFVHFFFSLWLDFCYYYLVQYEDRLTLTIVTDAIRSLSKYIFSGVRIS